MAQARARCSISLPVRCQQTQVLSYSLDTTLPTPTNGVSLRRESLARSSMSSIDNVLLGTYLRTRSGFIAGALRLDRAEEARARSEALRQLERVGLAAHANELAGNLP